MGVVWLKRCQHGFRHVVQLLLPEMDGYLKPALLIQIIQIGGDLLHQLFHRVLLCIFFLFSCIYSRANPLKI